MSLWMARLSLSNSSLLSLSRCSWRVIDLPTARDALPPTPAPPDQATILALLCLALLSSSPVDDCGAPACCCPTAPASPSPGLTPKIPPYAAASAMALPATRLYFLSSSSLLVPGFHRLTPHAPQLLFAPMPPARAVQQRLCCSVNFVDQPDRISISSTPGLVERERRLQLVLPSLAWDIQNLLWEAASVSA